MTARVQSVIDEHSVQPGISAMPCPPHVQKNGDAQPESEKALILDGNTRSALAATRSLGKKGVRVVVAEETKHSLAGVSKYCCETFTYPSITCHAEAFIDTVRAECRARGIKIILPMAELSTATVISSRGSLEPCKVPFARFSAFENLTDKIKLIQLAQRLNVRAPKTHFITDIGSLDRVTQDLTFPAVLKPHRSRILLNGSWIPTTVNYVSNVSELRKTIARHEYLTHAPFLIQEYIAGEAQGIFALYNHGAPLAFFAHRRLRQKPPTGGVSVLSESIQPNPEALRMAKAILDHVGWHGVAMIEFKVPSDGKPYLMEANGRFWGSLQLAIDAGLDFPWLLYQLAIGIELPKASEYRVGVKCRWLLGDLLSLLHTLAGTGAAPGLEYPNRGRSAFEFLRVAEKNTRFEVNRWDDLKPFFQEFAGLFFSRPAQVSSVARSFARVSS